MAASEGLREPSQRPRWRRRGKGGGGGCGGGYEGLQWQEGFLPCL